MAEYLYRRNTVLEALRGQRRPIHRLWLQKELPANQGADILAAAKARGVPVQLAEKGRLSQLAADSSHQGAVLEVEPFPYSDVSEILALAATANEKPFILLLDQIQGPQNVGSLLRTAESCGVHGVILQERRAPDITPQLVTYSAGATEHLLIAQVTNLVATMKQLQAGDLWIVGLDLSPDAQPFAAVDLNMPLGIVVGHEGSGLRRLVRERCDILLKLPMRGRIESLNAAIAGSILLFAAWQARDFAQ